MTVFHHGQDVTNLDSNSKVSYVIRESVHPDAMCDDSDVEGGYYLVFLIYNSKYRNYSGLYIT